MYSALNIPDNIVWNMYNLHEVCWIKAQLKYYEIGPWAGFRNHIIWLKFNPKYSKQNYTLFQIK